ncbi:glycosyltransferase [Sphingosinicellaceae bacterium]|nr:glycosyltransferase [Sphingosinicellaceae bacterium]
MPRRLVVGSWPGRSFHWNSFVAGFCDSLEAAGCDVVDVDDPRTIGVPIDVLHIHWPEKVFWAGGGAARTLVRTFATIRALTRLRRSGVRLVWMVHNLRPHDVAGVRQRLWSLLSSRLARLVDGYMTLSPATVPTVQAAFPELVGKPLAAVWHPLYEAALHAPHRAACRNTHPVAPSVNAYAFFGQLKRYKGVADLIRVFAASPGSDQRLLIAGHADSPEFGEQIERLAASDRRIELRLGRLSDAGLLELVAAADVIVLPFRDYLHSGSMVYALSCGRPVITPSTPFAEGLANVVGRAWVRTYSGALTPADLVFDPPHGAPDLSSLSWSALGEAATGLYRGLVKPVA